MWLAVDKNGQGYIHKGKPVRMMQFWFSFGKVYKISHVDIKKKLGKDLSWNNEPVEIKDDETKRRED